MRAYIDIENSRTKDVITITVDVLKYEIDKEVIFDISSLNNKELKLLEDAIDEKLTYTDIEMFFIDDSNIPDFGPDYNYKMIGDKLILTGIPRKPIVKVEETKNEDWTLNYEEEFDRIASEFLKTDAQYLLIYGNGVNLEFEFIKSKPKDTIFMDLFFDKNYNMIALFKKREIISNKNLRDNLEYINSYCEEETKESRKK